MTEKAESEREQCASGALGGPHIHWSLILIFDLTEPRRRRRSRAFVFRMLTTEDGIVDVRLTSGRHFNPSEELGIETFLLSSQVCGALASFTVTDY
jgi:hypothetical protein